MSNQVKKVASAQAKMRIVKMSQVDDARTKVKYADGRERVMTFKKSNVNRDEPIASVKRSPADIPKEKKRAKLKKKKKH